MQKTDYYDLFRTMSFIQWQYYIDKLGLYKGDVSRFINKRDLKRLSLDKCRLLYSAITDDFRKFV